MGYYRNRADIGDLVGKVLTAVEVGSDIITFKTEDGMVYDMYHEQSCCESVTLEDVIGEVSDLVGSPIIQATQDQNSDDPKQGYAESWTWTFYNLATSRGHVTLRWYGSSNGYYSETANLYSRSLAS